MTIETKSTNALKRRLLRRLVSLSRAHKSRLLRRVAEKLGSPRRRAVAVNVGELEEIGREGEVLVVPGKVLGGGELTKKLTVVAYSYSVKAWRKIKEAGGTPLLIEDVVRDESLLREVLSRPKRLVS
ncbi:MAG: 50S ribosomal protein L18e [Fervidicoccaceae archaeon]